MTDLRVDTSIVIPVSLPSPAPSTPEEALSWLGDTVAEVAEGLRARGIKGAAGDSYSCPVATYLKTWWPRAHVWASYGISFTDDGFWENVGNTPMPIYQFACDFDDGAFPDLIADWPG